MHSDCWLEGFNLIHGRKTGEHGEVVECCNQVRTSRLTKPLAMAIYIGSYEVSYLPDVHTVAEEVKGTAWPESAPRCMPMAWNQWKIDFSGELWVKHS